MANFNDIDPSSYDPTGPGAPVPAFGPLPATPSLAEMLAGGPTTDPSAGGAASPWGPLGGPSMASSPMWGDPNSGGSPSPLLQPGPLGGRVAGSDPFGPLAANAPLTGGPDPAPSRAAVGAGTKGHDGNVAAPPDNDPVDANRNLMQMGLGRLDSGDRTIASAYGAPMPAYAGPSYGLKDLLMGGVPLAALLLDHRAGRGQNAGAFLQGYMGGKQQYADQDYGRAVDQFKNTQQGQVALGQMQSNQGQRMLSAAEQGQRYAMYDADKALGQIRYYDQQLNDPKTPPDDVPRIAAARNALAVKAGMGSMLLSPDDIALSKAAAQKNLDYSKVRPIAQAAVGALFAKGNVSSSSITTAANVLNNLASATNPDGSIKYPGVLQDLGINAQEIAAKMATGTAMEQAQLARAKFLNSASALDLGKLATLNAIRQPTVEEIEAGTYAKNSEGDAQGMLADLRGLQAKYLPQDVAIRQKLANGRYDQAEAAAAKSKQDVLDAQNTVKDTANQLGHPSATSLLVAERMMRVRALTLTQQYAAAAAMRDNLNGQAAGVANGTIKLPPGVDPTLTINQLRSGAAAQAAKLAGIEAAKADALNYADGYNAERTNVTAVAPQTGNEGDSMVMVGGHVMPIHIGPPGGTTGGLPLPTKDGTTSTASPPPAQGPIGFDPQSYKPPTEAMRRKFNRYVQVANSLKGNPVAQQKVWGQFEARYAHP